MNRQPDSRLQLLRLQKKIHRSLEAQADRVLGELPDAIKKYEREGRAEFKVRPRPSDREELINAIRANAVTFVADYHSFGQAQRTALRLLRSAWTEEYDWILGLEMVPSRFQKELDLLQEGKLPLSQFLHTIRYEEEWGFPWSNYAPLLEWARQHGVRPIALNRPKELGVDLAARDEWSAGVLVDLFADRPKGKPLRALVLYGELHVARLHLPDALKRVSERHGGRTIASISVHQTPERLYWNLAAKGELEKSQVWKLGRASYCVFSSTPWSKLQSWLSWAENGGSRMEPQAGIPMGADFDPEHEDDHEGSAGHDALVQMETYSRSLAELLGVQPPHYGALTVRTADDADFVESLGLRDGLSPREVGLARYCVASNLRFHLPQLHLVYLGAPSENGNAEMAALHLLHARSRFAGFIGNDGDDFYRMAIESAFAFFGSLVINPRRKCDRIEDHRARLKALERGTPPQLRHESSARALCVTACEALVREERLTVTPDLDRLIRSTKNVPVAWLTARYLGQIAGTRLHQGLIDGILSGETVRHYCLARMDGQGRAFESRFRDLWNATRRVRIAATKAELL